MRAALEISRIVTIDVLVTVGEDESFDFPSFTENLKRNQTAWYWIAILPNMDAEREIRARSLGATSVIDLTEVPIRLPALLKSLSSNPSMRA